MKGSFQIAVALTAVGVQAVDDASVQAAMAAANPIRKVVTMLTAIKSKVEAEGEKEAAMYKKYMCYCSTGAASLGKSIGDADVHIPEVESSIKESEAQHAQLGEDLTTHRADRAAAKKTMEEATAQREKEHSSFAAFKAESDANIGAIDSAVKSLVNGMSGTFLQTKGAEKLRKLVQAKEQMNDGDRDEVMAFLSASQDASYVPSSGDITGILKELGDEMSRSLADATSTENAAVKGFDELMAAKNKEVAACTAAIEDKTVRVGELAVSIAQMKNDLSDTAAAMIEDKKFLADLDGNCATKTAEWEVVVKTRGEELVALSDTIKVLQDDDALELFKKTLPSASASLVQIANTNNIARSRALAMIQAVQASSKLDRPKFDFIALALRGKRKGFAKVIGMIDSMVGVLKKEQTDDDDKKEYCALSLDAADDKKKGLERSVSDAEAAIESSQESIATLVSEIKALKEAIKDLDKSVAEAGEQRKNENSDFTELMAQNTAAKELLGVAKNRLNKFYNPKLYVAPPKRELSEAERITVNMGGTLAPTPAPGGIAGTGVAVLAQISSHRNLVDPGPAPEAVPAYSKKSESNQGVTQMIDLLIKDLDKEMTVAETDEKESQSEYEQMTKDAADKRASDSSTLSDKESAKADTEAALEAHTDGKAAAGKELMATQQYIASLHSDCDWLMKYFDMRQEARASEIDALGKAKAVLSGADYSLLQKQRSARFLA
jgi:septal ring factor EnvC (AmiA/AmiB activator)